MNPSTIVSGPSLSTAPAMTYRPVVFQVEADSVVPPNQPMYCDIFWYYHISDTSITYYRTIAAYSIALGGGGGSLFVFDIQDALQEMIPSYMFSTWPTGANPIKASAVENGGANVTNIIRAAVGFRGSTISGGIITPNTPIPVAATATTPAGAIAWGAYSVKQAFYAIKMSSWSYNYINTIAEDLLAYSNGSPLSSPPYPLSLSRLPKNPPPYVSPWNSFNPDLAPRVYPLDSIPFPVLITGMPDSGTFQLVARFVTLSGPVTHRYNLPIQNPFVMTLYNVFYLPAGLGDLIPLMSEDFYNTVFDPGHDVYYYLSIQDASSLDAYYYWASPMFKVMGFGIETTHFLFQNSMGQMEGITFERTETDFTTQSETQFVPYAEVGSASSIVKTGHHRLNVRAYDEFTVTSVFSEALMPWVKDFMQSVLIQMQAYDLAGDKTLLTVTISDSTIKTLKSVKDGRINYRVTLKLRPALDYIALRN
jgi:hypothetical protein